MKLDEKFKTYRRKISDLGFLIFTSIPVLISLCLSFFDAHLAPWPQVMSMKFVGLGNFIHLLGFHIKDGVVVANDVVARSVVGDVAGYVGSGERPGVGSVGSEPVAVPVGPG